ncbi:hypothetical protein [Dysgonomonas sp. ZJ279]|uniref:hypothetical protein n=1 Tax=Dysgonomonas sp. ZJ279 TaxID=2709796 RepID=UPI0013EB9E4C|nr:hypothetical protein [Dysgonomonas sp. ZJ279]
MKKLLILLFTVLTFAACEGPEGPMGMTGLTGQQGEQGPQGVQGEPGEPGYGTSWYVTSFTIQSSEWQLMGAPGELNSYYYLDKSLPELNNFVFNQGTVVAYIETEKDIKNGLPYVLHKGGSDNQGEFLWTQTFDFDFYPKGVRFYLTYSDFNTQIPPDTETFHIVLMW